MSKIESLKREVEKLTPEELAASRDWFATYDSDAWDQQIERCVGGQARPAGGGGLGRT